MDVLPQVNDLVRVGRGTVPWQVTYLSPIPGLVSLSSMNTAMHRSEMIWNLSPFPEASEAAADVVTHVAAPVMSRGSGKAGLVVGGLVVVGAVSVALVAKARRRAAGKVTAAAEMPGEPAGSA